jgi:hypothetical protein
MSHVFPACGGAVTLGDADFLAAWGTVVPSSAFSDRLDVVEVIFPARINLIGAFAFAECVNMQSLTLPPGVKEIGQYAFYGCCGLRGALTLPSTLSRLGDNVFEKCSGLTGELVIPASLDEVSDGAFLGCRGLTSVRLETTELRSRSIGRSSFRWCSALTSIYLHGNVVEIKPFAFSMCCNRSYREQPTLIALPQNLQLLGEGAFSGSTTNVRVLVVPMSVSDQVCTAVATQELPMLEMVSAPNAVVSALGGHFMECRRMADVPSVRRVNSKSSGLQMRFWSPWTHRYLCTASQKACVVTAMLVGAHPPDASAQVHKATGGLPELASELWSYVILTFLQRHDFGPTIYSP